jgi:hypothetical protein
LSSVDEFFFKTLLELQHVGFFLLFAVVVLVLDDLFDFALAVLRWRNF